MEINLPTFGDERYLCIYICTFLDIASKSSSSSNFENVHGNSTESHHHDVREVEKDKKRNLLTDNTARRPRMLAFGGLLCSWVYPASELKHKGVLE